TIPDQRDELGGVHSRTQPMADVDDKECGPKRQGRSIAAPLDCWWKPYSVASRRHWHWEKCHILPTRRNEKLGRVKLACDGVGEISRRPAVKSVSFAAFCLVNPLPTAAPLLHRRAGEMLEEEREGVRKATWISIDE